jgi:phthiodiolone/phenolphthiodiolone dimycocerosates ketoreductase
VEIEFGAPGTIIPPAAQALTFAQRAEEAGYESIWWPSHLMGWHPQSVWTDDVTPLAKVQGNPHTWFHPLIMMSAAGAVTERIRIGVVVTDVITHHPAVLAHAALTLDHVTQGRLILGLGSGEQLNVTPYGMEWDKPVGHLDEGLDVIRLLWENDDPVSFDGQFYKLEDAVLGLSPYTPGGPPIWIAAHGPRSLRITGAKADGWLPTKMFAEEYGESLSRIREASVAAGRPEDSVTAGMLGYVLVGPDEETVERIKEHPLVRLLCILMPSHDFEKLGIEPPLGGAGSGFHDFVPTRVERERALELAEAIPPRTLDYYAFCGTVDQVVDEIAEFHAQGLRHLILWNITAFGDPTLAGFSFRAMNEIRQRLRER